MAGFPLVPPSFTTPRYSPDEVRSWFGEADAGHGGDPCPSILAPLHILLPILKRRIGPIGKTGQMTAKEDQQTGEKKGPTYAFRKIEDIVNEGHGPLCDLGVSWRKVAIVRHELTANGRAQQCVMEIEYEIVGPLGDTVRTTAVGQATDFGSDKATNKADTAARKNMLVDLLQLATEDPDSERPDRVDEAPHVQRVSGAQWTEIKEAIERLPETERDEVKDWATDKGMVVTGKGLTVGDYRKLKPYLAAIRKRLEAAGGDTVQAAMDKLADSIDKAKEARERHPQPPTGASTRAAMDAATDKAPSVYEAEGRSASPPDRGPLITEQAQNTLLAEIRKLSTEQLANVNRWAADAGIPMESAEDLATLTVDDFNKLMAAIRNTLRAGTLGTAKRAAGRPAKKAAAKPPEPPVDEEAQRARQALRAGLIGRAELLPDDLQDRFLSDLADNKGPSGLDVAGAIEACPPAWDAWLAKAIERAEAEVPDDEPETSELVDDQPEETSSHDTRLAQGES